MWVTSCSSLSMWLSKVSPVEEGFVLEKTINHASENM